MKKEAGVGVFFKPKDGPRFVSSPQQYFKLKNPSSKFLIALKISESEQKWLQPCSLWSEVKPTSINVVKRLYKAHCKSGKWPGRRSTRFHSDIPQ